MDEIARFDLFEVISIISLLPAFKLTFNESSIHEGAPLRFLQIFITRPVAGELNVSMELKSRWHKNHKKGTVTSHCEAINYLLER